MSSFAHTDAYRGSWLAPTPLTRQRLLTAIFRDAWALLPVGILLLAVAGGPIAVRQGARPEYVELGLSIAVTVAMAVGAGVSGGTSSPLVYLLPLGIGDERPAGDADLGRRQLRGDRGRLPRLAAIALAEAEIGYRRTAIIDDHGHDVGDRLLRQIAYEVRKNLRRFELVHRIGDEELLVLLPGRPGPHQAAAAAGFTSLGA